MGANDVFILVILGRSARFGLPDCAPAEPTAANFVAAMVTAPIAEVIRKPRRVAENDWSDIVLLPGRRLCFASKMLSSVRSPNRSSGSMDQPKVNA
jgi:hypothetical protein